MNTEIRENLEQKKFWSEKFGDEYVKRNKSMDEVNQLYKQQTGITQEEIFKNFFKEINHSIKILEIGCNIGLKLSILKKMGFSNLYGLEINKTAIEIAKKNLPDSTFYHSDIEQFDSKDEKFDLVYTSGVLIHINPSSLNAVIQKIIALSNRYIFGFEYYADDLVEIPYRGHTSVLWKQNFPQAFRKLDPSIRILKEEKIHYKDNDLCDIAYLLEKP